MSLRAAAIFTSLIVASFGGLLFACDEVYADPVTRPFTSGPTIRDAGLTTTRRPPTPCPHKTQENSPCKTVGSLCEYGESIDQRCNTLFVCAKDPVYGTYWTEQAAPRCDAVCPDPSTIVDGAPCTIPTEADTGDEEELHCAAGRATCICTTGRDGAHAHARTWVCKALDQDCPSKRPLLGQPCAGERSCDYGACESKRGARMICDQDVWQVEAPTCE